MAVSQATNQVEGMVVSRQDMDDKYIHNDDGRYILES